jgi:hypothetical protein
MYPVRRSGITVATVKINANLLFRDCGDIKRYSDLMMPMPPANGINAQDVLPISLGIIPAKGKRNFMRGGRALRGLGV